LGEYEQNWSYFVLKNSVKVMAAIAVSGALYLGANTGTALAQQKLPEAKVAIVDVANVLDSSRLWKEASGEMKAQVAVARQQVEARRTELKTQADELKRQQAILAPDVFQQKVAVLQQDERKLQREMQLSNVEVNKALTSIRGKLRALILKVSASVAFDKGLNLGMDKATVLFFDNGMDITKEVLKRFNASKTQIEIKPKG
jgi:outer membrane protein